MDADTVDEDRAIGGSRSTRGFVLDPRECVYGFAEGLPSG